MPQFCFTTLLIFRSFFSLKPENEIANNLLKKKIDLHLFV